VAFTNSDGIYLWSRTMSFANCAVIRPPAAERGLCPRQSPAARPAASSFIWAPDSPLNSVPGKKFSPGKNALAQDFALRAIAAQPGGYAAAVLHDFWLSFAWNIPPHPSALMTRRYEFAYATTPWISPGYVLVTGHTVASDRLAYGGAGTATRAVAPFAGWLRGYQRFAYLRGTLLGAVLLTGLARIARAAWTGRRCGGVRADLAAGGDGWGGAGLFPWLASVTLLLVPVMTADYSQRYALIAVPTACLAGGLACQPRRPARAPGPVAADARTAAPAGP
jgi:hypothetical protein